jgi:alkylated DNA repair protein (DNA oxidative demethylase)
MDDLFCIDRRHVALDPGAVLLGGFALAADRLLLDAIASISKAAPFRNLETPGGRRMSVAMTNAGRLGWVSDRRGYRYQASDPQSGDPWPAMPAEFAALAREAAAAAGYHGFAPEACLINRYERGAKLSLHQDRDERNLDQPIVSVSIGVDAWFLWGGLQRSDVVVWGGPARLVFHGIDTLAQGAHKLTGAVRYNLTFRRAA